MTTVLHEHELHPAPAPPAPGQRPLLRAGRPRALWMAPLFAGIGFAITVGLRALGDLEPVFDWKVIVTTAFLTAAPLGYLAGIGCFDYWAYYASGRPTRPEDHSGHGARSWQD